MSDIISIIEDAFENRASISPTTVDPNVRAAVEQAIDQLDRGEARAGRARARRRLRYLRAH